jgi:glucose/arabinose dehydrogenase
MKKIIAILFILSLLVIVLFYAQPYFGINVNLSQLLGVRSLAKNSDKTTLKVSKKFAIEIYAKGIDVPRFMHITKIGDLLVTEPFKGRLLLIPYDKPDKKIVLVQGLNKPHSLDILNDTLYIAESDAIGKIPFDSKKRKVAGPYKRIIKGIPDDGGHWTRTIKFSPDGYAYVSIGSSCNVCIEKHPWRASIIRFKPGIDKVEIVAKGLRNAVGFDWSPIDGKLYATGNGRDWLGDDFPPDELNHIQFGQFYGWPYANGNRILDPDYGKGHEALIEKSRPPVFSFEAHNAPLGITFIKNPKSPLYRKAVVALHGSWNSSVKVGYKVVNLTFGKKEIRQSDFITGFLNQDTVLGRPVHLVEGIFGELYLSDDYNGIIYRITLKDS